MGEFRFTSASSVAKLGCLTGRENAKHQAFRSDTGECSVTAEQKIAELGIILPVPATAIANYVGSVSAGSLLVVSGQLPLRAGVIETGFKGKVGATVDAAVAARAARLAAINVLAQAHGALGSLDRVRRVVRLGGFINAAPGFTGLPAVMNGASDLMVEIFGDAGRHARTTVGVCELPLDACIEVEALFEIEA